MTEKPEQPGTEAPAKIRKACQITLMFQCEDDQAALAVKKQIDPIVANLPEKRYTFNISEV